MRGEAGCAQVAPSMLRAFRTDLVCMLNTKGIHTCMQRVHFLHVCFACILGFDMASFETARNSNAYTMHTQTHTESIHSAYRMHAPCESYTCLALLCSVSKNVVPTMP